MLVFEREVLQKVHFSLKNTQFAIEMNGEQPSNSTFWRSSLKTNSLTTPEFFLYVHRNTEYFKIPKEKNRVTVLLFMKNEKKRLFLE